MSSIYISLTDRQAEIFYFIVDFLKRNGFPPTRKDIAKRFGFASCNAAEQHLRALEKKGAISIANGLSRGITIIAEYSE